MSPLDRIESYVTAHDRRLRRIAASALTVWLAGWVPTIAFTDNWPSRTGPQLYAWWIILGPLALLCAATAGVSLWCFYAWALSGPPREVLEQRIAALERELDIR